MLTPPLKWHGGKHYLAKRIIALMPPHLHYVEPYFGGGAVLLARDPERDWFIDEHWRQQHGDKVPARLRGCSEVVNDVNRELINFWRVLKNEKAFGKFRRIVEATPFSREEWLDAEARQYLIKDLDVEAAVAFFVRCRQSRAGKFDCFATLSKSRTRRGMNEQVSAWWNAESHRLSLQGISDSSVACAGRSLGAHGTRPVGHRGRGSQTGKECSHGEKRARARYEPARPLASRCSKSGKFVISATN